MSETFLKNDLISLRKELGLTQQQMADQLDMALRAYQSIESGQSEYRYVHRLAAERIALAIAADKKEPTLAPDAVRRDAIELVRVGQETGQPSFRWDTDSSRSATKTISDDDRFRASYGVVGELVLIATALDHQLNHVVIEVLPLADSPMLEAAIATLDTARKIEMLKARSKHIVQTNWQKPVLSYLNKLERVSKWRNIACHTPLIPDNVHGAIFAPTAAAKLLKDLQLDNPTGNRVPVSELKQVITLGESALGDGLNLIDNFKKVNAARVARYGK
jgi:transcriptional regulator with XRE-family HTH domain